MFEQLAQCSVETWCQIGLGVIGLVSYGLFVIGLGRFSSTNRGHE
jgi:hypothetical protein